MAIVLMIEDRQKRLGDKFSRRQIPLLAGFLDVRQYADFGNILLLRIAGRFLWAEMAP